MIFRYNYAEASPTASEFLASLMTQSNGTSKDESPSPINSINHPTRAAQEQQVINSQGKRPAPMTIIKF